MKRPPRLENLKNLLSKERSLHHTIISYFAVLAISSNLSSLRSPLIGLAASTAYFVTNATLLGNAFFESENALSRPACGALPLLMLLGSVGWLIMIICNLDVLSFTLVLLATTTLSSFSARGRKRKSATH